MKSKQITDKQLNDLTSQLTSAMCEAFGRETLEGTNLYSRDK